MLLPLGLMSEPPRPGHGGRVQEGSSGKTGKHRRCQCRQTHKTLDFLKPLPHFVWRQAFSACRQETFACRQTFAVCRQALFASRQNHCVWKQRNFVGRQIILVGRQSLLVCRHSCFVHRQRFPVGRHRCRVWRHKLRSAKVSGGANPSRLEWAPLDFRAGGLALIQDIAWQ